MDPHEGHRFPGILRLKRRDEFLRARKSGRLIKTRSFIIYIHCRNTGPTRLGVTASRKIGGAVQRNRVKRLVREFFRSQQHSLALHHDYSIIARRPAAAQLKFDQVCRELAVLTCGE